MERKRNFKKNGLDYRRIDTKAHYALFELSHIQDGVKVIDGYEICETYIRDDQYGRREAIPSNEEFGKHRYGKCFYAHQAAIKAFAKL